MESTYVYRLTGDRWSATAEQLDFSLLFLLAYFLSIILYLRINSNKSLLHLKEIKNRESSENISHGIR